MAVLNSYTKQTRAVYFMLNYIYFPSIFFAILNISLVLLSIFLQM